MKSHQIQPEKLVLRCMAIQRPGYWMAMCIDLDLVAQAATAAQARKLLKEQTVSYVLDAMTVDSDHAGILLKRKAPLRYRFMYHAIKLMNERKHKQTYEAAMPMIPACA
ncbi:MAG: hypothetical protein ACK5A0_11875 [Polaromonas sp.]|jgi:RecA/RadA recombinase